MAGTNSPPLKNIHPHYRDNVSLAFHLNRAMDNCERRSINACQEVSQNQWGLPLNTRRKPCFTLALHYLLGYEMSLALIHDAKLASTDKHLSLTTVTKTKNPCISPRPHILSQWGLVNLCLCLVATSGQEGAFYFLIFSISSSQ